VYYFNQIDMPSCGWRHRQTFHPEDESPTIDFVPAHPHNLISNLMKGAV
jgi:hypothetical protein